MGRGAGLAMYNLMGAIMAVIIVGGGYAYYFSRRGEIERTAAAAAQAAAAAEAARPRSRVTLPYVVVLFGSMAIIVFVARGLQSFWDARHPAVKEHLGELIAAAAERTDCPPGSVKIHADEPMQARAEGCGKTLTFRWGQRRGERGRPEHWYRIDPNCTYDYMGCARPCN
jgi:hypothetical protein